MLVLALHHLGGVRPELGRHHLGHVATESVDALLGPELQDVGHLLPRVGHGVEVAYPAGIVVYAVIQLHRFVPVVLSRGIVEVVVACSLGGLFQIGFRLAAIQVEVWHEALAGAVVEVVLRVEAHHGIVRLAQVFHAPRLADGLGTPACAASRRQPGQGLCRSSRQWHRASRPCPSPRRGAGGECRTGCSRSVWRGG